MSRHDYQCKGCGQLYEVHTKSIRESPEVPVCCGLPCGKDWATVQIASGDVVPEFWSNGMNRPFSSHRAYREAMKVRTEELIERTGGTPHSFEQVGGSEMDYGVDRNVDAENNPSQTRKHLKKYDADGDGFPDDPAKLQADLENPNLQEV